MTLTGLTRYAVCVKGSIHYDKKANRYFVAWYHAPFKRTIKIWFYKGVQLETRSLAEKLLALMQGDTENGTFLIEKYTQNQTDVIPYLESWLKIIKPTISPNTYKDYKGSINNHLKPFFMPKLIELAEIQYDTIMELIGSINRSGKGKLNVVMCLHDCMKYAYKSNRIPRMPDFPERKKYNIVRPIIKWLPEQRQDAIINAIPLEDQPIFWFLKYTLRRPAEAMALLKEDYGDDLFIIRRGISNYQEVNYTKDGSQHTVPIVSALSEWIEYELQKQKAHDIVSPYMFVSLRSRKDGGRYTARTMQRIWKEACDKVGESIDMYHGTKHSRACQLLNEYGLSKSELREAGDWARMDSVDKYASTMIATRKNLLEGKFGTFRTKSELKRKSNYLKLQRKMVEAASIQ